MEARRKSDTQVEKESRRIHWSKEGELEEAGRQPVPDNDEKQAGQQSTHPAITDPPKGRRQHRPKTPPERNQPEYSRSSHYVKEEVVGCLPLLGAPYLKQARVRHNEVAVPEPRRFRK